MQGQKAPCGAHWEQSVFWIHFETDSVPVRAEFEELLLRLHAGNGCCARATCHKYPSGFDEGSIRVLCFDAASQNISVGRRIGACSNVRQLTATARHGVDQVNLYALSTATEQTVVTVSLAGGTCGKRPFGPRTGCSDSVLGNCTINGTGGLAKCCNSTRGVGVDYWRGLFDTVSHLRQHDVLFRAGAPGPVLQIHRQGSFVRGAFSDSTNSKLSSMRPNAIILSYGLHYPHCNDVSLLYTRHVNFWLSSLRAVYEGTILWRSVSPPQFDADLHAHAPTGCQAIDVVRRLDAVVRPTLRAHGAFVIDTAPIVSGWANATVDSIHIDGGVLREWHNKPQHIRLRQQPVTDALLDALLIQLRAEDTPFIPAAAFWPAYSGPLANRENPKCCK